MKGFQVYQSWGTVLLVLALVLVYFQIVAPLVAMFVAVVGAYILCQDDQKRKSKSKEK